MFSRVLRALAATLVLLLPVHVIQAAPQDLDYCGGANQRACCFDEATPSCDPGNVESGSTGATCGGAFTGFIGAKAGQCIPDPQLPANNPNCGGEGQRACCIGEAFPSCESGLIEVPGGGFCPGTSIAAGQCIAKTPCGAPGQRACCIGERATACNEGAAPLSGGAKANEYCGDAAGAFLNIRSGATCVPEAVGCGGEGQRACCFIERGANACDAGMVQQALAVTGDATCSDGLTTTQSAGTCVPASPPQRGPLPEPTTNFVGPSATPLPPGSLRGYADLHLHLVSHLGHGKKVLVGYPAPVDGSGNIDPVAAPRFEELMSPTQDQHIHGGALHFVTDDPISFGTNDRSSSFSGAPYFSGWPSWNSTTHQQAYYAWLERAWRGGMRLTVMHAVTNEALCKGQNVNGTAEYEACNNSMPAILAQIEAAKDFEKFIDQQSGGPGLGWFRIVRTPVEARQAILSGKLAVIIGIEVDNLFACKERGCPKTIKRDANGQVVLGSDGQPVLLDMDIDAEVQKLFDLGVRHIFPVHNFDNAFGAAATWQDSINVGQAVSQGRWWEFENCKFFPDGTTPGYGFRLDGELSQLIGLLGFGPGVVPPIPPNYVVEFGRNPNDATCNRFGLNTSAEGRGYQLLNSLMNRGMLIDIDHMSNKALNETITHAQARAGGTYPLIASHVQFFERHDQIFDGNSGRHERMRTKQQLEAIRDSGGMVAAMLKDDVQDTGLIGERVTVPYTTPLRGAAIPDNCVHSSKSFAQSYQYAVDTMGGPVAFGSDFNGIAGHIGPRFGSEGCAGEIKVIDKYVERLQQEAENNRVPYPFEIAGFGRFDRQVTGFKTFDYNNDGMAHVGLLPDFIKDLEQIGMSPAYMDAIFCSAEKYIHVWERALAISQGQPPPAAVFTCTTGAGADNTPPTSQATATPAPNAAGWNKGAVNVTITAQDNPGGFGLKKITYSQALGAQITGGSSATSPLSFQVTADGVTNVTYSAEDAAGNVEASKSLTLKVDRTPPVITASPATSPTSNWYLGPLSVNYSCSDATSGVATSSQSSILPNGANQTAEGTCGDVAGNLSVARLTGLNVDSIAPTIVGSRTPIANANGWNATDVAVTFECNDAVPGSGVAACTAPSTLSTEAANQSVIGSVTDRVGNTAQTTVSGISIDKTAPTISGVALPPANPAGWNNSAVNVDYTCADNLSGVPAVSCGPDQSLTAQTPFAGTTSTGTATDLAGNTAQTSVGPIKIDLVKPTISGTASPAANSNGWNNTGVTVTYSCADNLSGVATCSDPQSFPAETPFAGTITNGAVTDVAGNADQTTVGPIKIDLTKPTITGAAAPAPNAAGWNNTNVTVTYTCNDPLSGVDTCTAPQTLAEGAAQSTTGTAFDKAGNSDTATVSGVNVDLTKPVVNVTGVADGAIYIFGSVPTAGCSTTDALSGVKTNATVAVTGGTSNGVGTFKARCSGAVDVADNAGNAVEVTYQVHYDFTGFFNPVDNPPMINAVKAGQGVPMKFSLAGNFGLDILAAASPSSMTISCTNPAVNVLDETETVAAGGSSLQYDALSGQYIYVWKTDKLWATKCRAFLLKLDDGTTHRADFNFRK